MLGEESTVRTAAILPTDEDEVALTGSASETEQGTSRSRMPLVRRILLGSALGVAVLVLAVVRSAGTCTKVDWTSLQGKSAFEVNAAMDLKAAKLQRIQNRTLADQMVMRAMKAAGEDYSSQYEQHQTRALPSDPVDAARDLLTVDEIKAFRAEKKAKRNTESAHAYCAFNVLEAFVSVVGMGDDINAIIRVCPMPRDGESELACQVDGAILVTWVANAAAKLSFAATNCALTLNVDAVCSVGVTGLVSIMGELAAAASLAAATCTGVPPKLTTSQISVLGDQTVRNGRRLLIGQGPVGNGVQCGVDVGMAVAQIANMGISIDRAVNLGFCGYKLRNSPLNKISGIPSALCTVDVGGVVAYTAQLVTFINLIIVHCQDFLDVNALCAGSVSGIVTAAAAIAPYGAAVHAACAKGSILKNPELQAKIASLYTVPSLHRRLEETESAEDPKVDVKKALLNLQEIKQKLEANLGLNISKASQFSQANIQNLLHLMDGSLDDKAEKSSGGLLSSDC